MKVNPLVQSLLLAFAFNFISCSSSPTLNDFGVKTPSRAVYKEALKKNTRTTEKYDGFKNTFQARVTFLDSKMSDLVLQKKAYFLQWDREELARAKEKVRQEHSSISRFFLSFYTPEARYNNLHRKDSIWRVYLVVNGQRYEADVEKKSGKLAELSALYPFYNRWSQAYQLEFPIPTTVIENESIKMIITSSLGQATLEYSAGK